MRWPLSAISTWVSTGNSTRADDQLLARQLLQLLLLADAQSQPASAVYAVTCNQIRAIGEALCAQGGATRMQAISALVGTLGGNRRDLEFYWDGICGWLY